MLKMDFYHKWPYLWLIRYTYFSITIQLYRPIDSPMPIFDLLEEARQTMRLKRLSIHTERAYVDTIRRFIAFHQRRHPRRMGAEEVRAYLSYLVSERNVAASTQNVAFNALLFLYRDVLQVDLGDLSSTLRARRPARLPVVYSPGEVQALLTQMSGTHHLMASLLYGGGLRLMECVRLRVKDLDFEYGQIIVRDGKGQKDRQTILPQSLVLPLREQIERVRVLHQKDVDAGCGKVYLPDALTRKYRNAARELAWQWVFPASKLSLDPRTGAKQRHHILEDGLQRAVKKAIAEAGLSKNGSCHSLRHSFATHLLEAPTIFVPCRSCWDIKMSAPP
jgi:integron integrase